MSLEDRVQREKEIYNEGLKRKWFRKMHSYANAFYGDYWAETEAKTIRRANAGKLLEVGSQSWVANVEETGCRPAELHCINISEAELEEGRTAAKTTIVQPEFHIMDGHNMEFPDNHFDIVFGNGILHHLEMEKALIEIKRVLKPTGKIVFAEPLDINPALIAIRMMTPNARTIDEKAFRLKEIRLIRKHFDCDFDYIHFLGVPFGILSSLFYRNPKNPLTRLAFYLDVVLARFPYVGLLYRITVFSGSPKN